MMYKQFLFYDTAKIWKRGSTCARLKVGAVIVNSKTNRIISTGYNGTPKGMVNCNELFTSKHFTTRDGASSQFFVNKKILDLLDRNIDVSTSEGDKKLADLEYKENFFYLQAGPKEYTVKGFYASIKEESWRSLHHTFSELNEVHAEPNAILNMFKDGTHTQMEDAVIYVTTAPCLNCIKLIASTGIKKVFYEKEYDRISAEDVERQCKRFGIELIKLSDIDESPIALREDGEI